ncbi:NADH dehydrogenase [ubiquinone] 1 alpha subcomplex assembly factor 1 [Metschnikowia aff. pulcherrima]|uniref:NADH dehydrogenase [ubiquinone] 1 alpha subcomplex assembly factor 1 n=1 Tax=Metschnikowia aff. pulcherrima TaxID=2163413 RepID=A0A4P6XM83_9ASCO|nr:NADH dehydrogenase [ubiquinone] 1 alpha subcomplex assembly factor 1 [Metschnikowia aff. pulcherrima]
MSMRSLGLNSALGRIFTKTGDQTKSLQTILNFRKHPEESLSKVMTRSDKEMGGFSEADFGIDLESGAGHFHGYLNLDLPKDNPEITRSGYAMFRTRDQRDSWLSGDSFWDWSQYSLMVLRVKGDRRKYLVNIQANTPLVTDLFQHRLFLHHPGEWETVVIPLNDFVMTNWGVIQDGSELNKGEVKTVGIGLLDKQYGPFSLKIDWIKVMTGAEVEKVTKKSRAERLALEHGAKAEEHKDVESNMPTGNGGLALNTHKFDEPKDSIF